MTHTPTDPEYTEEQVKLLIEKNARDYLLGMNLPYELEDLQITLRQLPEPPVDVDELIEQGEPASEEMVQALYEYDCETDRKHTTESYYENGVCVAHDVSSHKAVLKEEAERSLIPDIFEFYRPFEPAEWNDNGFVTRMICRGVEEESNIAYSVMECEYIDMKE